MPKAGSAISLRRLFPSREASYLHARPETLVQSDHHMSPSSQEAPNEPNSIKPELFFGLVSAIGTDVDVVREVLSEVLSELGYSLKTVRLSNLLAKLELEGPIPEDSLEERYEKLMDAGNKLREMNKRGDAVAILGTRHIREELRAGVTRDPSVPAPNLAYVFQSLKHPDEVVTLRSIYRSGFSLIGAYASQDARRAHLTQRFARSRFSAILPEHRRGAEVLIARDEKEEGNSKYGQNVQDAFPLADIFVDVTQPRDAIKQALARYIALLFGHPYHTPTRDEYAMFHAYAASLRSSALGRQVGAVITSAEGEIIALGCNDVPKPGGGLFWAGDNPDGRDFARGIDSSDEMKLRNLTEILQRLERGEWLDRMKLDGNLTRLVEEAVKVMKGTRVMSPIEFGRAVHAEMAAFMDAARRGISVRGCTLYTTTFPCHNCAMHIIAAGIRKLVFVEPYPKSLATELFSDLISVQNSDSCDGKVQFVPFVGIAPPQYTRLFSAPKRKKPNGEVLRWPGDIAWPRLTAPYLSYIEEEDAVALNFTTAEAQTELPLA